MFYLLIFDTGKLFVAEDSPVYINEQGEGVTDLAYYHPFVEAGAQEGAVYNPFDTSAGAAGVGNFSMGKKKLLFSKTCEIPVYHVCNR